MDKKISNFINKSSIALALLLLFDFIFWHGRYSFETVYPIDIISLCFFEYFVFSLSKTKSPILAIFFSVYAVCRLSPVLPVPFVFAALLFANISGNIIISATIFLISIGLVAATIKYQKINNIKNNYTNFIIKTIIGILTGIVFYNIVLHATYPYPEMKELTKITLTTTTFISFVTLSYSGFFPFGNKLKITQNQLM